MFAALDRLFAARCNAVLRLSVQWLLRWSVQLLLALPVQCVLTLVGATLCSR